MTTSAVDIHLDMGETEPYEVVSCTIQETVAQGIAALVRIAASQDIELDRALLGPAKLSLTLDGIEARRWTLVVASVRFAGIEGGLLRYEVRLRDLLYPLTLVTNTRKFRRLTTEAIVDRVLADHDVASRWCLRQPTPVRNWCVQYRETNHDFVLRLLEHEGVYFSFDDDGTLLLGDDSGASAHIDGRSSLELVEAEGALQRDPLCVMEARKGVRVATGSVTLNDHNWKHPRLSLMQGVNASRDAELEVYDHPGGYRDPTRGGYLAKIRLEAARSQSAYLEGRSNVTSFRPARRFELLNPPYFADHYVLTRIEHQLQNPAFKPDHEPGYQNRFDAIPLTLPFRPQLERRRPVVAGFHTAMVRGQAGDEIHTDQHGRFKAQFHWDREATGSDEDSRWMRMLQETATSMTLARVGWEVNVGYIAGDPDRPIGLARNINGEMVPAYGQPANKTLMTIKTPSSPASGGYNELKLDDTAGAMRMDLRAERDLMGIVKNDRSETVGNDELHVVGEDLTRIVDRDHSLHVGADATRVVNGDGTLQVQGNRDRIVGGREDVDVGAAQTLTTESDERERTGSVRLTIAGGVGLPNIASLGKQLVPSPKDAAAKVAMGALSGGGGGAAGALASFAPKAPNIGSLAGMLATGAIIRTAQKSMLRMVGGAWITVAVGNISTNVLLGYAETVGGVKITVARKDIGEQVGLGLATTVGGAVLRSAVGDMGFTSKLSKTTVGGLAHFRSAVSTTMSAATVAVTTAAGLALRSGDVSIDMKPGSMSITGDLKLEAPEIKVSGNTENLTSV
jgi:type VI secretion system secreted protein VgrG